MGAADNSNSGSGFKHSLQTDALDYLGSVCASELGVRDAVHLAVIGVAAAEGLRPGQHVSLDGSGCAVLAPVGSGVGIVDPFLQVPVGAGDVFQLMLYPRTISSLRHVWEHPAFAGGGGEDRSLVKQRAEVWLREYLATNTNCPGGLEAMESLALTGRYSESKMVWEEGEQYDDSFRAELRNGYVQWSTDASGELTDEFWRQMEVYLGVKLDESVTGVTGFSCAC